MNRIHLKRLKRRRILQGRQMCHGNKIICPKMHRTTPLPKRPEYKKLKKIGWFRRLINFFRLRYFLLTHPKAKLSSGTKPAVSVGETAGTI